MEWSPALDRDARQLVVKICDRSLPQGETDKAWRAFLILIAPHVELWAARSHTLRRCKLTDADETRSVLVEVIRRLAAREFEALRAFVDQRPASDDELDGQEQEAVDQLVKLLTDAPDEAPTEREPSDATPLRAWLLQIVGFAAKDHVRARLGRRAGSEGEPATKRAMGTDAERLDKAPEAGERPPITDLVTLRKVLAEIQDVIQTFPAPMQKALALWADETSFDVIARELSLDGPAKARDLVRAATARLREKFRDRFPTLAA